MTVQLNQACDNKFEISDALLADNKFIDALIRAAFVVKVDESCRWMSTALLTNQVTPQCVRDNLWSLENSVQDYLDAALDDIRHAVAERFRVAQYSTAVTAIHYNLDGPVRDIDVMLDVNFSAENPPKP